jgi:hypothetical protein
MIFLFECNPHIRVETITFSLCFVGTSDVSVTEVEPSYERMREVDLVVMWQVFLIIITSRKINVKDSAKDINTLIFDIMFANSEKALILPV